MYLKHCLQLSGSSSAHISKRIMGKTKKPPRKKQPSERKGKEEKDDDHDSGSEEVIAMQKSYQPSYGVIDPDE